MKLRGCVPLVSRHTVRPLSIVEFPTPALQICGVILIPNDLASAVIAPVMRILLILMYPHMEKESLDLEGSGNHA